MKKVFKFFKNFFSKNGFIKFLIAFVLLMIAVLVVRNTSNSILSDIFEWIGLISFGYMGLTILIFLIVGIVNAIKDHR